MFYDKYNQQQIVYPNNKLQVKSSMYNSFAFKKHSQQLKQTEIIHLKHRKWIKNYQNIIRPALIEKYSRRINNFVVRLEEDKKELYQYREKTQQKAHELLKEIYRKQRYLGDPNFKVKDSRDWNSILSTTDRIEKQKNKRIFEQKYGDSSVAFRSIASQSAYNPAASTQFRQRVKQKQIHSHHMKFSSKSDSFAGNRKEKRNYHHLRTLSSAKIVEENKQQMRRANSNQSHIDEQNKSHSHSVFSFTGDYLRSEDTDQKASNHKQIVHHAKQGEDSSKVYFKQIVDLQQNSKEPSVKKSLHQILVRFGISRIKDIKKQAMVETDNLQADEF